jgi:hypothetical protein
VATRSPLAHGRPHEVTQVSLASRLVPRVASRGSSPNSSVSPRSCHGVPTVTLDLSSSFRYLDRFAKRGRTGVFRDALNLE